jgi:branched-chain amino acid transport system permease protein
MTGSGAVRATWGIVAGLAVAAAALAVLPLPLGDYWLSLLISILLYWVLTGAWALFSAPTRYVSLATSAFFGVGAYLVAWLAQVMPLPAIFAVAALAGLAVALIVGLSTLRISGMYFVIFSFGLSELIRELAVWWEINQTKTLGRFVFVDFSSRQIYWHLLGLAMLVAATGWLVRRSRLGFALRVIGDDEDVARQVGINVAAVKVAVFALSAVFMTVTGAVMAPRYSYITPNIVFNPMVSFQVVIMALLGGLHRLWGPLLGVVPVILLSELLAVRFPYYYTILLGVMFLAIVYFIPQGLAGLLERGLARFGLRKPAGTMRGA